MFYLASGWRVSFSLQLQSTLIAASCDGGFLSLSRLPDHTAHLSWSHMTRRKIPRWLLHIAQRRNSRASCNCTLVKSRIFIWEKKNGEKMCVKVAFPSKHSSSNEYYARDINRNEKKQLWGNNKRSMNHKSWRKKINNKKIRIIIGSNVRRLECHPRDSESTHMQQN